MKNTLKTDLTATKINTADSSISNYEDLRKNFFALYLSIVKRYSAKKSLKIVGLL